MVGLLSQSGLVLGGDSVDSEGAGKVLGVEGAEKLYQDGLVWLKSMDYAKAYPAFETAVKSGHSKARGALGFMILQGLGCSKDESAALVLIREAAGDGVVSAQVNLAGMLMKGQGGARDIPAALSWYEKAAGQGSADARLRLVDIHYFGQDGIAADHGKALPHVKVLAGAGNAKAQNILGSMFEHGQAVDTSRKDAVTWYREAAIQGEAKAQSNLGRMIRTGHVDERGLIEACQWLTLSADQGETTAIVMLEDINPSLTAGQKYEVEERVREYRKTFE